MGYDTKDVAKALEEARQYKLKKDLEKSHEGNLELLNSLGNTNPKYAKHILAKNELVMTFAKRMYGGIEILNQPVCRSCEGVATWDIGGTAYCFNCNVKTNDPISVKEYLIEYTDTFTQEQIEAFNSSIRRKEDEGIIIK